MSHPLLQGDSGTLSSPPRSQVSKKEPSSTGDDSTGMEIQGPANRDLDLAPGVDEGNVPGNGDVEDSVSLNSPEPEEEIADVSTDLTNIHDNPIAAAGNDDDNKSKDIIFRVYEEDHDESPECGSFERRGEEKGVVAEVPTEGDDEDEVPAQLDGSVEEDEFPGMCAYEILRERNIRERKEFLKEVMGGINEAKQHMHDNAPKKRKADNDEFTKPKRRRVKEVETVDCRSLQFLYI